MNKTETHILKLPKRVVSVEVTETDDRVTFYIRYSKDGDLGDKAEFMEWMIPLMKQYVANKKEVVINDLQRRQRYVQVGDYEGWAQYE